MDIPEGTESEKDLSEGVEPIEEPVEEPEEVDEVEEPGFIYGKLCSIELLKELL